MLCAIVVFLYVISVLEALGVVASIVGSNKSCFTLSLFGFVVDANEVPDYYDIVKHPMDFSSIKRKLEVFICYILYILLASCLQF